MYKHVCTPFSFISTLLIVDPTAEEDDLATGTVTTVTDEEGRLCSVHKPRTSKFITKKPMEMTAFRSRKDYVPAFCGSLLKEAKLQDCITRAITRHKEVKKVIDKVISIMPK